MRQPSDPRPATRYGDWPCAACGKPFATHIDSLERPRRKSCSDECRGKLIGNRPAVKREVAILSPEVVQVVRKEQPRR